MQKRLLPCEHFDGCCVFGRGRGQANERGSKREFHSMLLFRNGKWRLYVRVFVRLNTRTNVLIKYIKYSLYSLGHKLITVDCCRQQNVPKNKAVTQEQHTYTKDTSTKKHFIYK